MRLLYPLKYVPAIVSCLLLILWCVSLVAEVGYFHRTLRHGPRVRGYLGFARGSLVYSIYPYLELIPQDGGLVAQRLPGPINLRRSLGYFQYQRHPWLVTAIPICWVLTALLPLAIGPWYRYRFASWMYFAWTALIAGQAAYFATRM
ncbi:hypothetical protein ETAA8_70740 [Anatilimnocola aggregata]|uniref:Uncharacterized protein n=1 Tax=Anatilimnocola aggregata TaxID=2528021 RepID=A0A517YNW2_9BACT|nr:hypothetical protein [Anatilimnocola aggregata]QDU31912.1 hypothetical protein ETAA8_70740 [Anatilimnocola aggregata]